MVKGLDKFAEHFKGFEKDYVLIGGTACELCMNRVGRGFRITKDLDIVFVLEGCSGKFFSRFWDFIRKGGYNNKQKRFSNFPPGIIRSVTGRRKSNRKRHFQQVIQTR